MKSSKLLYKECTFISHQKGLTLIEILMAVALLSILTALSLPSFNHFFAGSGNIANTNAWMSSVDLAKSYATSQSTQVVICPLSNSNQCGSNEWENGWLMFNDTDMDSTFDSTDELLSVTSLDQENKHSILSTSNIYDGLIFTRMGIIKNIPANEIAIVTFDHQKSKDLLSVTINNMGSTNKQKIMK